MMMENIKQILGENGRTISDKDRGLASMMMDNEPRMQDRSAEGQMFSLESEIKNLMKEYEIAVRDGDNERAQRIADIINELDAQKIDIQEKTRPRQIDNIKAILNAGTLGMTPGKDMGGMPINMDPDMVRKAQMEMGDLERFGMAEGGEAQMEMSEQEAMSELESIAPQAQMIEQLIVAVVKMIQQGVSEAEVREFLKEQGLDDEDIEDLFMMVMEQIEQAPVEEPIGRELQGMM